MPSSQYWVRSRIPLLGYNLRPVASERVAVAPGTKEEDRDQGDQHSLTTQPDVGGF